MKNEMTFHGSAREFFWIWVVNMVLSILTLGIYSAWAKVRTNKYFYGNTEVAGSRFDYHATPKQILIGRIIAVALFVMWSLGGQFFPVLSGGLLLVAAIAYPWLARNNARFDARMTSYRNVRLNFNGSLLDAYMVILGRGFLLTVTIIACVGFASAPTSGVVTFLFAVGGAFVSLVVFAWMMKGIASYFANGYGYGKLTFNADLSTGFFVSTYVVAFLLAFGTAFATVLVAGVILAVMGDTHLFSSLSSFDLGVFSGADASGIFSMIGVMVLTYAMMFLSILVASAYIAAKTRNHIFSRMLIGETGDYRLDSAMTTTGYTLLVVTNFLLQVVTLGLARPWVKVRTARYLLSVTIVHGDMDALNVYEDENTVKSAAGDEVSQVFDLEIGIN